jgi:pyruvate carboxylase
VDKDGRRAILFELNGMPRGTSVIDRSIQPKAKSRAQADPASPLQVGAPIPGLITSVAVSVGTKIVPGDKLFTLEAMKMQTTVYAACDGVVDQIHVQIGDTVESKDLLMTLRH